MSDKEFQKSLAEKLRPHKQLGGVLVARDIGVSYRCALVRNPAATSEITPETERMVMGALETPYDS